MTAAARSLEGFLKRGAMVKSEEKNTGNKIIKEF
jgi:hypothetical protein